MCRHNQLWGFVAIAFGLGILIGTWIESGFLTGCLGLGLVLAGCACLRKR